MDQVTTVYSRKSISNWLKNLPYSQNLNDGVLFCKILQKTDPSFPKYIQNPRTQYDYLKNFRLIQKHLQKNDLYHINDVSRFAATKDFFEFNSWLYSHYSKKMNIFEPLSESILTMNKSIVLGNTSRVTFDQKQNSRYNIKENLAQNPNIDFQQVYKDDIKNLLILTARKDDIGYLENIIRDIETITREGQSIEQIKTQISKRFYGNFEHLL